MYNFNRCYTGSVRACIFDWSGTLIDKYSFAPVNALITTLKDYNIDPKVHDIRQSMGVKKDKHIQHILNIPDIKSQWLNNFDSPPSHEDINDIYKKFKHNQKNIITEYTELFPEAKQLFRELKRSRKTSQIKIAGTTGFSSDITNIILNDIKKQGIFFDTWVSGDDVNYGSRPNPFMLYKCMENLNIPEIKSVIKIDDTVAGIQEGLNAGCWTVGVVKWSNHLNVESIDDYMKLTLNEKFSIKNNCKEKFKQNGAHFVIDNIYDMRKVIKAVNEKLNNGIKP